MPERIADGFLYSPEEAALHVEQKNAEASADTWKADAEYQDQPNGDEQCIDCTMFVGGGYCKKVIVLPPDDTIDPFGWCKFFESDGLSTVGDE